MLQQLPKSPTLRQSLCAQTCKNDVTCAGYASNDQGCFSCLADFTFWQDAQCTYQNENKGCTPTGQCLLCPATQSGFAAVFKTLEATKFMHLRLYISSSCHHFDTTPLASHKIAPITWPALTLRAQKSIHIVGPGSLGSTHIEAPQIKLSHLHFTGPCYVKTKLLEATNLFFSAHDHALILHDSPSIDAKLTGLTSTAGPAVGAIACDGGTLLLSTCKSTNAKVNPYVLIQDTFDSRKQPLSIQQDNCTWIVVNTSHEFDLFSREYEVRYFNTGYYTRHDGLGSSYVFGIVLAIVVLVVTLPLFHQAIWNTLLAALSRKHESKQ